MQTCRHMRTNIRQTSSSRQISRVRRIHAPLNGKKKKKKRLKLIIYRFRIVLKRFVDFEKKLHECLLISKGNSVFRS